MVLFFVSIALFCLPAATAGYGEQDVNAELLELSANGAVVMTDEIDLHGPEYRAIPRAAGEGKTFLVIDVKMKFSRTDVAVFFNQINLFTADAKKIPPAYFAVSYDPTRKTYAPAFPVGEGTGGFMKKVPGGMKVAFVYINAKDETNGALRWGLGYKNVTETTVFIFEIDKTDECVVFTMGNKAVELRESLP